MCKEEIFITFDRLQAMVLKVHTSTVCGRLTLSANRCLDVDSKLQHTFIIVSSLFVSWPPAINRLTVLSVSFSHSVARYNLI